MKKNILVVDDDDSILTVMKIILEESGYYVKTVSNSDSVEDTLKTYFPDLILLDIWMSGRSGRDITRSLKNTQTTSHIPIIIISAHNETQQIAKEAGADAFLEKPFDIDDLLSTVKKYTTQASA